MNKKGILLPLLVILGNISYAMTEEYEGPSHYRVFDKVEIFDPIERGAYENILRLVDEQNRKKGTPTNYLERAQYKSQTEFDHVNLVPIAQFTGGRNKYEEELKGEKTSSVGGYSSIHDIVTGKDEGLKKSGLFNKLTYSHRGNTKRFFFGNGNQTNDILMTGSDDFDKKVMDAKNAKKDLHLLEGTYERPGERYGSRDRNQLALSLEEYKALQGKTKEQQLQFLAERMSKKLSIEITVKNGELYTKDDGGKEWRVLWSIEPISEAQISYGTTKKLYKDDIFTNIFVYVPTKGGKDKTDSRGRVLYTKDKDIVLEDKYEYGEAVRISEGLTANYLNDKKKLSEDAFRKKWILPFAEGGEFAKKMEEMIKEIGEVEKEKEVYGQREKEASQKIREIEDNRNWPSDFYVYTFGSEREKKRYIEEHPEAKELIENYLIQEKRKEEARNKQSELQNKIDKDIPKKNGLYAGWEATAEDKKWLDRVIANKSMRRSLLGKNVEFRGQGRIEGTVDFGEGHNELTIAEQFTGKYGTNIILGPKAKLKNIAYVNVSGAIGNNTKASLSGRTSLTLDIDPEIKDKEGRLIQHALKDSDKTIVFRSTDSVLGSTSRNDFSIELMSSRVSENAVVDMGRKLRYTTADFSDPGKEIEMRMNIISDSIVHTVSEKAEMSKEGNSLLSIEVKDSLKRFDKAENEVYASIKNSGRLNLLQPTLTTTNKKTVFQAADDDRDERKKTELIRFIRTKKPEDILKEGSDFYLDPVRAKEAISKIEKIANFDKVKKLTKEGEELKKLQSSPKYKELNLVGKREIISTLNPQETWNALSQNRYSEEKIQEKFREMKEVVESIDEAALSDLLSSHPSMEHMANILQQVKYLKKEIKKNPKDSRQRQGLFATFKGLGENLEKQNLLSEDTLDNELAKYLETFRTDVQRDYFELKDMLFYSIREEEAFSELKNMVEQLKNRNIYSKLNKIAKSEISTYTNFPFDIDHSLLENRAYARGGFLSSRTVQDHLKGNIYTGYGIYEEEYQPGLRLGVMMGGANTNYTETYSRTLRTVATQSTIQGVNAYAGAYANKTILSNVEWITGFGLQYGFYTIKRQMRNNYQGFDSKGKSKIGGVNTYTGIVYTRPLANDLILRGKGILSYSLLQQGKIDEKNGLNLEIASQKYQYVDGELGISLAKTLYDDSKKSTLSGGISGIFGLSGYANKPLKGKIKGSSTGFDILGDTIKKDSIKIHLDYNMQIDTGFNYGLEGTYITNKDQSDVKIGLKAGYRF